MSASKFEENYNFFILRILFYFQGGHVSAMGFHAKDNNIKYKSRVVVRHLLHKFDRDITVETIEKTNPGMSKRAQHIAAAHRERLLGLLIEYVGVSLRFRKRKCTE